jgi:hypothetical protein
VLVGVGVALLLDQVGQELGLRAALGADAVAVGGIVDAERRRWLTMTVTGKGSVLSR